jgi:hypothetical protein
MPAAITPNDGLGPAEFVMSSSADDTAMYQEPAGRGDTETS